MSLKFKQIIYHLFCWFVKQQAFYTHLENSLSYSHPKKKKKKKKKKPDGKPPPFF